MKSFVRLGIRFAGFLQSLETYHVGQIVSYLELYRYPDRQLSELYRTIKSPAKQLNATTNEVKIIIHFQKDSIMSVENNQAGVIALTEKDSKPSVIANRPLRDIAVGFFEDFLVIGPGSTSKKDSLPPEGCTEQSSERELLLYILVKHLSYARILLVKYV